MSRYPCDTKLCRKWSVQHGDEAGSPSIRTCQECEEFGPMALYREGKGVSITDALEDS